MASSCCAVATVGNDAVRFSQTKALEDVQTTYLLYLYYKHSPEATLSRVS